MLYSFQPSVVVARRRHGAQLVFLGEDDRWTPVIGEAELIEDEAHGDIRLLDAEIAAAGVTDVHLARVVETRTGTVQLADSDMSAA